MSTNTKTHIHINVLYAIYINYSGKKKTAKGIGNKFSFGGAGTDLKLMLIEYYFMRHHKWILCSPYILLLATYTKKDS